MCHLRCCAICVLVVMCWKSMTLACRDSFSLKLNYNEKTIQLKDSNISSIQMCMKSSSVKQKEKHKSSEENFTFSCILSRKNTVESFLCNSSKRFENCPTGVHLIHKDCPRTLIVFENMTILCLNSSILSFKNCNVISDNGEPISQFEVIIIAIFSSVTLLIIIILIFICIVKNSLKLKPSQGVAQIKPENECTQIESNSLDHASSSKTLKYTDTIISLFPKISEMNDNLQSPETTAMKKLDNASSLDTSGNAQVSIMQANSLVGIRSRLSIEPPAAASSKEIETDFLDESNVYSLIDAEGGDGLQVSAREPLSLLKPRRQIDVQTADGTISKAVNDTRDVYSILGEGIRDFQNPYNATPSERKCKKRASYDSSKQCHLTGPEGNESTKFCVAEANDVYSRHGQEIKEFDNTYNITPNEKAAPSNNQ